jgi:hypothetical protein
VLRSAVARVAEPNERPAVRRGPPSGVRPAVRRGRSPALWRGRSPALWRGPSVALWRGPSVAGGREARRGLSADGIRGGRREPSPGSPSRPASPPLVPAWRPGRPVRVSCPARLVRASCPARLDAGRPRPWLAGPLVPRLLFADPLVPVGQAPLLGAFAVPEGVRAVFGVLGIPPPLRPPPPLASGPLGVLRPSATPTNLQHLPTTVFHAKVPDKRRGPLDLIGSDPLQTCPAASYSPTRSPTQYHRR